MNMQQSELAANLVKLKDLMSPKTCQHTGILYKGGKLSAYNLKVGAEIAVAPDNGEEFIIPPRALELISKLPDDMVSIVSETPEIITVSCGKIRSSFPSGKSEDYPSADTVVFKVANVHIDAKELSEYIKEVSYAVSRDEMKRPVQTGILFEASGGNLNIVACDGMRLAWRKAAYAGEFKFVLPADAAHKIATFDMTGEVEIYLGEKKAIFRNNDYTIFSRLLSGEFVAYKRNVPDYESPINIDASEIIDGIDRCIISIDSKQRVPIRITLEKEAITLDVETSIGKHHEAISLDVSLADNAFIGINPWYLRDALKSFKKPEVKLGYKSENTPITITDGSLTALVLPVRLSTAAK